MIRYATSSYFFGYTTIKKAISSNLLLLPRVCREVCVSIHLLVNINFQIELLTLSRRVIRGAQFELLGKTRSGINRALPNSRNEGLRALHMNVRSLASASEAWHENRFGG